MNLMALSFLLITLAGTARAGAKEEVDPEILKDLEFFYYMDVVENREIIEHWQKMDPNTPSQNPKEEEGP